MGAGSSGSSMSASKGFAKVTEDNKLSQFFVETLLEERQEILRIYLAEHECFFLAMKITSLLKLNINFIDFLQPLITSCATIQPPLIYMTEKLLFPLNKALKLKCS